MRLIDNWRDAAKFHSVRVAGLWGLVCGVIIIWPAFQELVPLWLFALVGLAAAVAVCVGRVTHQPGLD